MPRIVLPTSEIRNEKTFHAVCQRVFGFPDFYAHTMDAWVDCLSCLDDPAADMSSFTLATGELLVIVVPNSANLKDDLFTALIDGTIAVNGRFVDRGKPPVIALVLA
ncbi:MAG: barstar family protein [Deltaproteobacteria bacterium]|nr:MAG: barstar family protein [Deltaproteobacteria bacterium]